MPGGMSAVILRVFAELGASAAVFPEPSVVTTAACAHQGVPVLLLGPSDSQKSGLLFVAAVLAAEEATGPVIFLSREPLEEVPRVGTAARDPLILKKIRFVYPSSLKDLLHFFSSLHLTSPSPSLILVDGLERFLPSSASLTDGAHISALMLDSTSHLQCGLIVSAVPGSEGSDAFTAVGRYFPNQCLLCPVMSTQTEERRYKVSFLSMDQQWTLHVEQDGGLRVSLEDRSSENM